MYFKPRIFISSTFKQKIELRNNIREMLSAAGAEPLLYEKDLTPSVINNTYRNDIKESDFVIFIIDDINGTPTKSGISGTLEEINITFELKKPSHVYIKLCNKDGEMAETENKMKENGVSFYYYQDDDDLITQINSTFFTIAREVVMAKINEDSFNFIKLTQMSYNRDYQMAIGYIAMHERMIEIWKTSSYDIYYSDLFVVCTEYAVKQVEYDKITFINPILNQKIRKIYKIADEYNTKHVNDFVTNKSNRSVFAFPNYGKIEIRNLSVCNNEVYNNDWYVDKFNEYNVAFDEFKKYVSELKMFIDIFAYKENQ